MTETEHDREDRVRTVRCPVCKAAPGKRCRYSWGAHWWSSHVGRYDLACRRGLVPALGGVK